ncbi:MAG TPA: chemotaxis protein CheX [Bryobacteraceae bacterium]|nr:chemotaxis protein CheX [Bryobacteraceae bacterium]
MRGFNQEELAVIIKSATWQVFSNTLGFQLAAVDSYRNNGPRFASDGVLSFVGLAGDWAGTGSLSCSARFACRLSSILLMSECSGVNDEVLDTIAEVTRMIVGNVRQALEQELGPIGLSNPTVIYGPNFTSRSAGMLDWTVVRFICEDDEFAVQLFLGPGYGDSGSKLQEPGNVIPVFAAQSYRA